MGAASMSSTHGGGGKDGTASSGRSRKPAGGALNLGIKSGRRSCTSWAKAEMSHTEASVAAADNVGLGGAGGSPGPGPDPIPNPIPNHALGLSGAAPGEGATPGGGALPSGGAVPSGAASPGAAAERGGGASPKWSCGQPWVPTSPV